MGIPAWTVNALEKQEADRRAAENHAHELELPHLEEDTRAVVEEVIERIRQQHIEISVL